MKRFFLITLVILAVIVFSSIRVFALPTINNGSFEADNFVTEKLSLGSTGLTGWDVIAKDPYPWGLKNYTNSYGAGPTPYGDQWVVVGYYGQGGSGIFQTVSGFNVGQTYTLNFALASEFNNAGIGALAQVSIIDGSNIFSQVFEAPLNASTYWDTWQMFSYDFIATATNLTIQFDGLAGVSGYDAGIDNVSISSAAVPEPSIMLLLGSGLVGLFGFRKKFKK